MSDGPHRSLPMRKPWRELAKRGDQGTYDAEQVAEAAAGAGDRHFKHPFPENLPESMALNSLISDESRSHFT